MIIFFAIILIIVIGTYAIATNPRMYLPPYYYWLWLAILAFFGAPLLVFSFMFDRYAKAYRACRKRFGINDVMIREYLGDLEKIDESKDFVIIKNSVLFFPKAFCIIPIKQIRTVNSSMDLAGRKAKFILVNEKKISVYTKQYEDVVTTINETKATL